MCLYWSLNHATSKLGLHLGYRVPHVLLELYVPAAGRGGGGTVKLVLDKGKDL